MPKTVYRPVSSLKTVNYAGSVLVLRRPVIYRKLRKHIGRTIQPLLRSLRRLLGCIAPNYAPTKMIGPFGPFKFDSIFVFSDFRSWGEDHNCGFQRLIQEARSARCVFDVGAHVGITALPLSAASINGLVVAFEPGQRNYQLLERHRKLNGIKNLRCENLIVGDENLSGGVRFYQADEASGMNSVIPSKKMVAYVENILMITLDSYAKRNTFPLT